MTEDCPVGPNGGDLCCLSWMAAVMVVFGVLPSLEIMLVWWSLGASKWMTASAGVWCSHLIFCRRRCGPACMLGVTRAGPSGPAGVFVGLFSKVPWFPGGGGLLESGSFLGNCEVMRRGISRVAVHQVHQNGTPSAPKQCIRCTKMVHQVHQNSAFGAPKWYTKCTRCTKMVHQVHQNSAFGAPKWYTKCTRCTKMVHQVHPVHQNQGVK